jgi:adenosylcobinamide amidohydrolase
MGSEVFGRGIDEFTITFGDGTHDAMTTDFGVVRHVRMITLGKGETRFSENSLYIHIDGDTTKVCVSEMSYNSTFVTAIAFADLSSGLERMGCDPQSGTGEVVLVLLMDSDMPDSTLARAGITATEGITASVQDLGLAYEGIPASGAVRQTIVTVRAAESGLYLRGAGKHTKLGELIGRSTIEAVKASAMENGVSTASRMSIVEMLGSYGYDQNRIFSLSGCTDYSAFLMKVVQKDSDPRALALISAALHVRNEVQWGLLDEETGTEAVMGLIKAGLREPVRGENPLDTLARSVALFFTDP